MLSQTLIDTSVVEHVTPMMNVLTDIHSGMQSLNLDHLTVTQRPDGKKGGDKKKVSAEDLEECEKLYIDSEKCVNLNR